jgi:hypothetical protein
MLNSKSLGSWLIVGLLSVGCTSLGSKTEEPDFQVVLQEGDFSVRQYVSYMTVTREVSGPAEDASNTAFRDLFRYISGDNTAKKEISMRTPVLQRGSKGIQISMTAPVLQRPAAGSRHLVSFVLPKEFTLNNSPQPTNPSLVLNEVPPRLVAVLRYTGSSNYSRYERELKKLEAWVQQKEYRVTGVFERAQYDPPWTPWFLRRNEVFVPIARE